MDGKGNKENQEISVAGRLLSMEALVLLMGAVSLVYGLATLQLLNIIIGAVILVAGIILVQKCRQAKLK